MSRVSILRSVKEIYVVGWRKLYKRIIYSMERIRGIKFLYKSNIGYDFFKFVIYCCII